MQFLDRNLLTIKTNNKLPLKVVEFKLRDLQSTSNCAVEC